MLLCLPLNGVSVSAADPQWVGVLAIATQPDTAKELGLTPDQLVALQRLVAAREAEAVSIAAENRKLPPAERGIRMRELVRELEQKAYRELSIQQRGRLERMRLSTLGLVSLAEKEVSETLGLSQGQMEQVNQVLSNREKLAAEQGENAARVETERRLRDVLTSSQWATWQSMAGQAARANPAPSQPAVVATTTKPAVPDVTVADTPKPVVIDTPKPQIAGATPLKANPASGDQRVAPAKGESELTLNFNATPWEEVLKWIAKEAELSLQYDTYPIGTFTYRDPYRKYTVGEALDIMNGVLLNKAYRLIRRQRSLMVIDLGNGESADIVRGLLRELAELVSQDELDKRGDLELLKCLFVLSRLSPEEAQKEIGLLIGPEGSTIPLGSAGQILVTETAAKLRLIRDMLKRVEDPDSTRGSKVVTIPLKHVSAEEILGIARPLLGLAEGTNQSNDFNVSTDTFGNTIFATGSMDKLQLLKDLALQIDVKPGEGAAGAVAIEQPKLRAHPIQSSDPNTAYQVLQTLLEGSANARLSLEPKTNNVIAMATEADHKLIQETLATLAGESSSFTVIPLKRIDVQAAITTLEKFFGKPSSTTGAAAAAAVPGPVFFGDALTRTLMVKGSPQELIQVRELLSKLEETSPEMDPLGGTVRVLPMTGKSADRVLEQIQYLWDIKQRKNRIRIRVPAETEKQDVGEKAPVSRVDPSARSSAPHSRESTNSFTMRKGKLVRTTTADNDSEPSNAGGSPSDDPESESDIIIYRGPTGLVVTCNDPKALAEFEQLARLVTDQLLNTSGEPTVFYLKYITAKSADELIRSILSGDTSGGGSSGGSGGLLGSMLGEVGGGLVGGLLGFGGGGGSSTTTSSVSGGMATGEISITADPRLNCLLVTANAADLDLIEQLLKLIDKEDSPIRIETQGVPRIIQVVHNDVEEIATIVKQVFADRITASAGSGGPGGGGGQQQQRQPSPQEFIEALRGAGGGGGPGGSRGGRSGGQSELKPQTMTIGTDKKNNALIVTASQSLFEQVEALVAMLDEGGTATEEKIEVVQLSGNVSPEVVQAALQSVLGAKAKTNNPSSTSTASSGSSGGTSGGSSSGSSGTVDAEAAQRRAEFFQALQRGGLGGGAPGGGFRGGTPGGGFRGGAPGGGGGGAPGGGGGGPPRTGR